MRPDFKSPAMLSRLLMGLIALFGIISLVVVFYAKDVVDSASGRATHKSDTALLAAEASGKLGEMIKILDDRAHAYRESAEAMAMTPEKKVTLALELERLDDGPANPDLAGISIPLSLTEASYFQETLAYLRGRLSELLIRTEDVTVQLTAASEGLRVEAALEQYYTDPSPRNLRQLELGLQSVQAFTREGIPGLTAESEALRDDFDEAIGLLRNAILGLAIAGTATFLLFGRFMSRHIQRTLTEIEVERAGFAVTTVRLQYRNDQLAALYNVFTEITDTLSLKYVVNATLRESMKIMHADMAVLRILRGSELIMAGAMTSGGQELQGLGSVALGEGPTGRTAQRGRSLRIDREGEQMMAGTASAPNMSPSAQSHRPAMQSGLIVPLVVGARVVGTLACWAIAEEAFNDEDQRILEMMASQVATAIVAADTTDTSVRHAHHDALTGLPNRRQLDEDIEGSLKDLADSGSSAVVAMVDIDHFKRFNDEYGHRAGDVTLQRVASVLRSSVRDNDYVYRYGGEEFVVVFSDTPPTDAVMLADRLRQAIEAAPLSGENLEPVGPVTVSIGLALLPEHGTDVDELIDMADKAMYRAKAGGRNRVEVWREDDAAAA